MVSSDADQEDAVFFNRHIPQAVLGTKTNNKRVMKRSKSYTVLMGN